MVLLLLPTYLPCLETDGSDFSSILLLLTCPFALQVPVEPGDVIIAGSDGLFDNVFDEKMCAEVDRCVLRLLSCLMLCKAPADTALPSDAG